MKNEQTPKVPGQREKILPETNAGNSGKDKPPPPVGVPNSGKKNVNKNLQKYFWIFLAVLTVSSFFIARHKEKVKQGRNVKITKKFKPAVAKKRMPPLTREMLKVQARDITSFTLRVEGSKKFKEYIREALKLILSADEEMFADLKETIYVIRQGYKTDFVIENNTPKILLTTKTAFESYTWCAGAIAHQLFLAMDYYEKKRKELKMKTFPPVGKNLDIKVKTNPDVVSYTHPDEIEELETRADNYQIDLMIKIGAPTYEITQILNREVGDYSLTHDGRY